jgi:hypothetical protein
MLHVAGGTARAGGALTLGSYTLTQANSTQKAATSPEGSAELWYLLNPVPGAYTLTIPNTGALTVRYVVAYAAAKLGSKSLFRGANGSNGTSANPATGTIACIAGDIVFSAVCSGATTWNPSAQTGTVIQNTDDGALGGGTQYSIIVADGAHTISWTQASDDWGAVAAAFGEVGTNSFNQWHGFKVGNGMSTGEKIR